MKHLILICLVCLLGCREEESIWDNLSDDERTYLREQNRVRCESESESDFEELAANSSAKLVSYERGDYWRVTVSSSTVTRNLRVWKVDGSNVYFVYYDPSLATNLFIKLNTTVNDEMFEDLRKKKCKYDSGYTITQSSSVVTVKQNDITSVIDSTSYSSDFTYTGSGSTPLFFSYFNVTEAKQKLNDDGDVVSTENLTNKIEYVGTDTDVLEDSFTSYTPRRYCIIKYTGSAGTVGTDKFYSGPVHPFSSNLTCTSDGADGTDPNSGGGDPAMTFTSDELSI